MPPTLLTEASHDPFVILQLDQDAVVVNSGGAATIARMRGEVVFSVKKITGNRIELELTRQGLSGDCRGSVDVGEISVRSFAGSAVIDNADRVQASICAKMSAHVLYDSMIAEIGYPIRRDDLFMTPFEEFSGTLSGVIEREEIAGEVRWRFRDGTLAFQAQEGKRLSAVSQLSLPLAGAPLYILPESQTPWICPRRRGSVRRFLSVRPVVFEWDGALTGTSMVKQFEVVDLLWGKCCVDLIRLDPKIITEKEIESSPGLSEAIRNGEASRISKAFKDNPNIIEIFFVSHDLADSGGAATFNGGMSQAKIVITDQNSNNPQLLAHEMGHVFNGDHPASTDQNFWTGDPGTVLNPGIPNPPANTIHNCRRVNNPALLTGKPPLTCCIKEDADEAGSLNRHHA